MDAKKDFRKKILNIRNSMDSNEVIEKSKTIIDKLTSTKHFIKSKVVFVYLSFNNEVDTVSLIQEMLTLGKRVVVPYTDVVNTQIIPIEIKSLDGLKKCSFGYLEPLIDEKMIVDSKDFDLVVVPGVVFDKNLNRIGFGKGYYDRILINLNHEAKKIAIAYDFQVLDEIPAEKHDVKVDIIITEKQIY